MPNRLSSERSAYLRSAAHQPIEWYPWGEEAFARAQREDKPILLDIGAVWCHWCHVLDQESYDDPEVAKIINEHFIPIKVDRDERPDIDARYQAAVSAISGQGGWPLTGFLTPSGRVFFGGSYFPPQDALGRPGFKRVLLSVAGYYRDNKAEAEDTARDLHGQLAAAAAPPRAGPLDPALVQTAVEGIGRAFDMANGGFGNAPKFPHPSAIELLLQRYDRTRADWLLTMIARTLEKMGRGGIHDQIGGGFHRYATDARWIVPHFEKMLYDNAGLLSNYARAFHATGTEMFRSVALDTVDFMLGVLSDPEHGGFFGSQDADVAPGDDGSYFTWSEPEARAALTADEFEVLGAHYHISGPGEMPHDPSRHVLFVDKDPDVIAAATGRPAGEVLLRLADGRRKLRASRSARPTPYVDTALYANWNGMAISAFLAAASALDEPRCKESAIRSLERLLREAYTPGAGFRHVAGIPSSVRLLDDQAHMAQALLDAYEATAEIRYLLAAQDLADVILRDFADPDGGFLDVPVDRGEPALDAPQQSMQDAPTPAAGAVAAAVLLRLSRMFDAAQYRDAAIRALELFAPRMAPHGLFASSLFLAVDDALTEPAHVTIVGPVRDARTRALHDAALRTYRPGKIISIHEGADGQIPLPPVVRAMVTAAAEPRGYVCAGTACAPPAADPETLAETIRTFNR
ncbi:MAG: thioredoxin domain-containing protein [bacterium]